MKQEFNELAKRVIIIIASIIVIVIGVLFINPELVVFIWLNNFFLKNSNLVYPLFGLLAFLGTVYWSIIRDPIPPPQSESTGAFSSDHHSLLQWKSMVIVDHSELIGFADHLIFIQARLRDKYNRMIVINGAGGVGKTTLTYELVNRNIQDLNIQQVAWVSAKQMIDVRKQNNVFLDDILMDVLSQLKSHVPATRRALIKEDFEQYVNTNEQRMLVVVDNLESIEAADILLTYFKTIQRRNKHFACIFTSRFPPTAANDIIARRVTGFKSGEAVDSNQVREYILSLSPDFAGSLNESFINLVALKSDGNPFIIRFIVRTIQHDYKTIEQVTQELEQEDAGHDIKKYLYDAALGELYRKYDRDAHKLMLSFCAIAPGENYKREDLREAAQIDDTLVFNELLKEACGLNLIRALNINQYFTVHSLLRVYICKKG